METGKHIGQTFEWPELAEMFSMDEDDQEYMDKDKRDILERINRIADHYGKEYVVKRIALKV